MEKGIRSPHPANPANNKEADMEPMLDYIERLATSPMDDDTFEELKQFLEEKTNELSRLNAIYRSQTGKNYVP